MYESAKPPKDILLAELAEHGEKWVAKKYKRCIATVRFWRTSYGVINQSNPRVMPSKTHLKDMVGNMLVNDVAKYYGVHAATVSKWKKKLRLNRSTSKDNHWNSKLTQKQVEEIRHLVLVEGKSQKAVAEQMGVAQSSVSNYCTYAYRV